MKSVLIVQTCNCVLVKKCALPIFHEGNKLLISDQYYSFEISTCFYSLKDKKMKYLIESEMDELDFEDDLISCGFKKYKHSGESCEDRDWRQDLLMRKY